MRLFCPIIVTRSLSVSFLPVRSSMIFPRSKCRYETLLLGYGIGRLIGFPSIIGLGKPPALLSKPFLLNTSFIENITKAEGIQFLQ